MQRRRRKYITSIFLAFRISPSGLLCFTAVMVNLWHMCHRWYTMSFLSTHQRVLFLLNFLRLQKPHENVVCSCMSSWSSKTPREKACALARRSPKNLLESPKITRKWGCDLTHFWEAAEGHMRTQPFHVTPRGLKAMHVLTWFLQPEKKVGSSHVIFGGSKGLRRM